MLVLGIQGEPSLVRPMPPNFVPSYSSGWFHDSAAVLLKNGTVIAAVEEERVTRRKHVGKFPVNAIKRCLEIAGASHDDIDIFAFGEQGGEGRYALQDLSVARIGDILRAEFSCRIDDQKIVLVEHHIAHAASAFFPSQFQSALVMTSDGFGDGKSGYIIDATTKNFRVLDHTEVANSLGLFYSFPLSFLGFKAHDEYKVMGLAPYGNPARFRSFFEKQYSLLPDGRWKFRGFKQMKADLGALGERRPPGGPIQQHHADVAACLQETLERIVFHALRHFHSVTGRQNLCLAGGTFQNSSLNGKLLRSSLFKRVFVQPAAHDAGVALGAALKVLYDCGYLTESLDRTVYWGTDIGEARDIERTLSRWREFIAFEYHDDICVRAARLLANGAVIGWAQGRAEFGPRALGNRSILADPRPSHNRDRVNTLIKQRESFRPFAPSIAEQEVSSFFNLPTDSRCDYMTFVMDVKAEKQELLGATTHIDGTARLQTVARESSPRFWELIMSFYHITGVPVLLNTSFNLNSEPIIDSAEDAIITFLTTALSTIVIGDYLVTKKLSSTTSYLNLKVALASGYVLIKYSQGNEKSGFFGPGITNGEPPIVPISQTVYDFLQGGDNRSVADDVLRDGSKVGDAFALTEELRQLWQKRLVNMWPSESTHCNTKQR